jgi:drug/metabolite transporter (DMT)-like permease
LSKRFADLLLIIITLIWGTTFTIVHGAVGELAPMTLVALRFGFAALVLLPFVGGLRVLGARGTVVGIGLGAVLFSGFALQTFGLERTSPGRAGFITGLNVVLVPILGLLVGQRAHPRVLIGIMLALVGLSILSWGCQIPALRCTATAVAAAGWSVGDTLILLCAVAFALHIVVVGRWAPGLSVQPLNAVQLLTVAMLATGLSLGSSGGMSLRLSTEAWLAVLFLGIVATALVFGLQLVAQRVASPARTALFFSLEPVFAAFFAWLWIGEAVTWAVWLGGGVMLGGILIAELQAWPAWLPRRTPRTALRGQ